MKLLLKQKIVIIGISIILVVVVPTIIFATQNSTNKKVSPTNKTNQEKIEKYDNLSVSGQITEAGIVLSWNQIDDKRLTGYKVVVSKNNETPKYPDDGYLYYITDKSTTKATIKGTETYNGGDFNGKFIPGQLYYFSVTAVYEDDIMSNGNAVAMAFPKKTSKLLSSTISGNTNEQKIVLNWTKAESTNFSGYKVVISKKKEKPSYPEDGYMFFIQDINKTSAIIDDTMSYNNGDFGSKLEAGQSYYFSITTLYGEDEVSGNSIKITKPSATTQTKISSDDNKSQEPKTSKLETEKHQDEVIEKPQDSEIEAPQTQYIVPKVNAVVEGNKIKINWDRIDTPNFVGYKVVASKNNANPVYPSSGYFFWITDKDTTQAYVDVNTKYNGEGDVGSKLKGGLEYYFSVTAIYDNDDWKKIAGNAIRLKVPVIEKQKPSTSATQNTTSSLTYAKIENGQLNVSWTKVSGNGFNYYKVVIAENKSAPIYPQDGYYEYFTDINTTSCSIDITKEYNGGDFGGYLESGHTYNISITSVFGNDKKPSNVMKITVP